MLQRYSRLPGLLPSAGGFNQLGPLDTVEVYDPATGAWSVKAPMRNARSGAAAAVVNGHLVVLGAYAYDKRLATVEAYDPQTDTWSQLTSMPTGRAFLSAVVMNDTIYAIGGSDDPKQHRSLTTDEALKIVPCSE